MLHIIEDTLDLSYKAQKTFLNILLFLKKYLFFHLQGNRKTKKESKENMVVCLSAISPDGHNGQTGPNQR